MHQRLTDASIRSLPSPEGGARIYYDSEVRGLGIRVSPGGTKAFVLNYRTRSGRERRFTIGSFPEWKIGAARDEGRELRKAIDRGDDPMGNVHAGRAAATVDDLCDKFIEEQIDKKRGSTKRDYQHTIGKYIRPALGKLKVDAVTFSDVDALHRKITKSGAPYQANRVIALCSRLFSFAIKWGWRSDNPAKGIERNQETKRKRYLSEKELTELFAALSAFDDQESANIFRLLLLTGARRGEVLAMKWADVDLEQNLWIKPGATTKQKTEHRVTLSEATASLLKSIRGRDLPNAEFVFSSKTGGHRVDVKKPWQRIRAMAGLEAVRIHDLRHTYASILASRGMSLPIIGALLGHTQPSTTARYAHLLDDPLRKATEFVDSALANAQKPKPK